jgi:hypothetical protein
MHPSYSSTSNKYKTEKPDLKFCIQKKHTDEGLNTK